MLPRKPNRLISLFVTLCFTLLEIPVPVFAQVPQSRKIGIFLVPRRRSDRIKVNAIRGLMTDTSARLEQKGIQVVWGAVSKAPANIDKVEDLVKQGKELLAKNKGKAALKVYTQAERLLRTCMVQADRTLIARVYKGLGVAFFMNHQMDMGQQMLERSLVVYPVQRPKEYAFSLDIRNNLTLAKQQIGTAGKGSIKVTSNKKGAMVFVDRKFQGFAPMTIPDLSAVEHLVEVIEPGYYEGFKWMMVVPKMQLQCPVKIQKAPVFRAFKGFLRKLTAGLRNPAGVQSIIASLSDMFDLNDVFFLRMGVRGGKLNMAGLYYTKGRISKIHRTLAFDANLMNGLDQLISDFTGIQVPANLAQLPPLDAPPAAAVEQEGGEEAPVLGGEEVIVNPNSPIFATKVKTVHKKKSLTEKWWFWTIIGAAVVGGFTAGFLLVRGGGSKGPTGTLQINLHGVQ